jgi:hypothetical protein
VRIVYQNEAFFRLSRRFVHWEAGASEQLSQSSQPLLRIINLSYPLVSILPEVEKRVNYRLRKIKSGPNLAETKH